MSCSIAVAHSSSRSLGSPRCRPAAASASHSSSASVATCSDVGEVGVVLGGEVAHGRPAHVVDQRRVAEQRLEEHALAQAGVGGLDHARSRRPPSRVSITSAPARIRSPRANLMPGTSPRSSGGSSAKRSISSPSASRVIAEALDAVGRQPGGELRGGGEVADRAADPGQPAALVQPRGAARSPPPRGRAAPSICLRLALPPSGMKRSVIRTAPSGHERAVDRLAVLDARELHRAAAEVEHDALRERRRVDRRQVAVAGLLLAGEHLDVEPRALLAPPSGTPSGWPRRGSPRSRPAGSRSIPVALQKCA